MEVAMQKNTAFKLGNGKETLVILSNPETAKDFIFNVELAIRPKDSGGFGRTSDFYVSVMGSSVSLGTSMGSGLRFCNFYHQLISMQSC
jgi:hypothetical protein